MPVLNTNRLGIKLNFRSFRLFIGLWSVAAIPATSFASTITLTQTLDLTGSCGAGYCATLGGPAFSPAFNVNLAAGDTFDYTIEFMGGQQLTVQNLSQIFGSIWTTNFLQAANISQTATLTLLSATGSLVYTSPVISHFDGSVHAGEVFYGNELTGLPSTVTFGGLHYVGTVNGYDGGYTTRNYDTPYFSVYGNSVALSIAAVPEPSSWAMMILGFAGVGYMTYRRRKDAFVACASWVWSLHKKPRHGCRDSERIFC
jgi:hypothetical protein